MPPVDRRWEFAVRSPGEFRVVRTESGPLALWVLGIPAGQGPADAAAWLRDVAEVAREGAAQQSGELPIPGVLYHALSGLLFAHADAWGSGRPPCAVAFANDEDGVGLGWVGPVAAEVWIDGRRESARLVTVRDAHGRDAFAWSVPADRDVRVVLRWPASVNEPEPFVIELESRWDGVGTPDMAWYARPAATAGWVHSGEAASAPSPASPAPLDPVEETPVGASFATASEPTAPPPEAAPSLAWNPVEASATEPPGGPWEISGAPPLEPELAQAAEPAGQSGGPEHDTVVEAEYVAEPVEASSPASDDPSPSASVEPSADEPAPALVAHATPETVGEMDPSRPSSGIARWLQRSFGWLGGRPAHEPTREPARESAVEPGWEPAPESMHAPALEPAIEPALETVPESTHAPALESAVERAPEPAHGSAIEPVRATTADPVMEDPAPAPPAAAEAGTPQELPFETGRDAAPRSREDELAESAAALAAMLGGSLAAVATDAREAPPLREDFEPAWRRTVEEASELVPPTPEPRELTERTASLTPPGPPAASGAPDAPAPLGITGSEAPPAWDDPATRRPPALEVPAPARAHSGEPFRPLGVTPEDTQALAPEATAPAGTPWPEPEVAPEPEPAPAAEPPASKLPSWLRVPAEAPASESPRDPREIALAPGSPVEPPPAAADDFDASSAGAVPPMERDDAAAVTGTIPLPEEAVAGASASGERVPEVESPEWAESPEAAPATVRRKPAMHPDWPSDVRLEKPKRARGPWAWVAAIVVVLFGVGWVVGMLQEPAAPGQRPRGPLGPLLGALGVRGPSFTLDVKSQPEGAWILVDGNPTEQRTPAQIPLAPGAHQVTLSFGQWGEGTFPVEGRKGESVPLDAQMWGSLELIAPEPGSVIAVSVDGRPRGFAPLRVDSLAPGPHQVRYSGPGIVSWGQTVEVGVGEHKELVARAISSPATGLLMVRAQISDGGPQELPGARVWIDGRLAGVTPLTVELPRGPHSIRASWQSETPPVQVIDLPGGNQRFATFQFGSGEEHPSLRVTPPARIASDGSTVIQATVDGIAPGDVREMWLHVEGDDQGWRRYPMTRLADVLAAVGAAPFPIGAFGANVETRWYASVSTQLGDEYFTEMFTARREGRPPR